MSSTTDGQSAPATKRKAQESLDAALCLHQVADQAGNAAKVLKDCITQLQSSKKKTSLPEIMKKLETTASVMETMDGDIKRYVTKLMPAGSRLDYVHKRQRTVEKRASLQSRPNEKPLESLKNYKTDRETRYGKATRGTQEPPPAPKNGTVYSIDEACSLLTPMSDTQRSQTILEWSNTKKIPVRKQTMCNYLKRYKKGEDLSQKKWGEKGRPALIPTHQLEELVQKMTSNNTPITEETVHAAIHHLQMEKTGEIKDHSRATLKHYVAFCQAAAAMNACSSPKKKKATTPTTTTSATV